MRRDIDRRIGSGTAASCHSSELYTVYCDFTVADVISVVLAQIPNEMGKNSAYGTE